MDSQNMPSNGQHQNGSMAATSYKEAFAKAMAASVQQELIDRQIASWTCYRPKRMILKCPRPVIHCES